MGYSLRSDCQWLIDEDLEAYSRAQRTQSNDHGDIAKDDECRHERYQRLKVGISVPSDILEALKLSATIALL